ncbi:MAG: hypothetical protein QJQ54_03400 [Mollicutes bacterium]|nr:MAG: hypothetical protein QJQ54_03400 [Mollicutes bacterium]
MKQAQDFMKQQKPDPKDDKDKKNNDTSKNDPVDVKPKDKK